MPALAPFRARLHLPLGIGIGLALALALALPPNLAPVPAPTPVPDSSWRAPVPLDSLPTGDFVVEGVRLFDGEQVREAVDVVVRDGRIAAITSSATSASTSSATSGPETTSAAASLPRVDGAGRTLLPLFVDAHVHTWSAASLEQALAFGVGVQLDMFTPPDFMAGLRGEQVEGAATGRADVLGATILATATGGHGTQFGLPIPTVDSADEADVWVGARVAEGADWIKIVLEPGALFGRERPTLDDATLKALVDAAHARGLLAVVHVTLVDDALRAVRAGADGLVHLWGDRVPTEAEVQEIAASGLFIVPTLVVQEGTAPDAPEGWRAGVLLEDAEARPHLDAMARETLAERFPFFLQWAVLAESVRSLRDAGVPLLVGSDAQNPGTVYGASVHRELELLVAAGLSPAEALAGATALASRHFRLGDRPGASHPGVLEVGAPAHLLLVEGDPTTRIADTRRIAGVWKGGIPFDRGAHALRVAEAVEAAARLAAEGPPRIPRLDDGRLLVGTFDDGGLSSEIGLGWTSSTDGMAGGRSTATFEVVPGGADGTAYALRVRGTVDPGLPTAWAGALYMAGATPFAPVDASEAHGIRFSLRIEDGESFQVALFSGSPGNPPAERFFDGATLAREAAEDGWTRLTLRWEEFPDVEPGTFSALLVAAGPGPGPFSFFLDEVAFFRDDPVR